MFSVAERSAEAVTLRLEDDTETRVVWPFAFRLDLRFAVSVDGLEMSATVTNRGDRDMPFSFGFHPAFRWPLTAADPREDHVLRFERAALPTIRRVGADGLLTQDEHPTPVERDTLRLDDGLFVEDALIFPDIDSRSLVYGVPGRPGLRIGWEGLPDLGIWMKPGGNYVCVEPWAGFAAPQGFDGTLWEKPGIIRLAPGKERRFKMTVAAEAAV